MPKENNKMQVDIDTLKKQNVNDLLSIKELYKRIEELGEKITQVKYIDNTLVKKLKKEYENLKKIILDENVQVQLDNKIDEFNLKLTHDIETINSQQVKLNNDIETNNSQLEQIVQKQTVSITDFIQEGKSHTQALIEAMKTGKKVKIPSGSYLIDTVPNTDIYLDGDGWETTEIITTGNVVFPNATKGNINGIKFKSQTPDTTILFENLTKNFSCKINLCYFEDYNYVINNPKNGNSVKVESCYFRNGVNGIFLNYAHDISINKNVFWQQKGYAINVERGTGSSIKNNNFVATNEKPSNVRFFSQQCTFEDNYMEMYDKTGIKNECWILVEYNNASYIPTIRNNEINGCNSMNYGVKYVGTQNNPYSLNLIDNDILSCSEPVNINLNNFSLLNIKGNRNVADKSGKRYYSCDITVDTSTGNNIVIPIDTGKVIDAYSLSNGDNTIKAYQPNKTYKLKVSGSMTATDNNTGIQLKLRNTNGTNMKIYTINSTATGEVAINELILLDTPIATKSFYRVDFTGIAGYTRPTSMNLHVELIEL